MTRFVEGEDRRQDTLLPECLDDYVAPDSSVGSVANPKYRRFQHHSGIHLSALSR